MASVEYQDIQSFWRYLHQENYDTRCLPYKFHCGICPPEEREEFPVFTSSLAEGSWYHRATSDLIGLRPIPACVTGLGALSVLGSWDRGRWAFFLACPDSPSGGLAVARPPATLHIEDRQSAGPSSTIMGPNGLFGIFSSAGRPRFQLFLERCQGREYGDWSAQVAAIAARLGGFRKSYRVVV